MPSNIQYLVEETIKKCQSSAADMRTAAHTTDNNAARNSFEQTAQQLEECVQKCRSALNQLVK
ncbi:MAG: DUF1657 domain-containing protein [Dethiobacter sp.]|jgi:hypothetical protein|nr:DUF1657 domain-containing protein [Dethiobacter sp.]